MSDTGIVGGYWPHGGTSFSPCKRGGELAQKRTDVWSWEGGGERLKSALAAWRALVIERYGLTPGQAFDLAARHYGSTITP